MTRATVNAIKIQVIDGQIEILHQQIADMDRIVAEVARTKAKVATRLQVLGSKKRDLVEEMQPINWLPPEILLQIFMDLCINGEGPEENMNHAFAVVISHVCRKWRDIALGMPELWSRIYLSCSGWSTARLSAFLERSRRTPLSIVYGGSDCFCVEEPSHSATRVGRARLRTSGFSTILERLSIRLQHLSVGCKHIQPSLVAICTFNSERSTFPLLTSLNLAITSSPPSENQFPYAKRRNSEKKPPSQDLISSTKALKHIRLEHIPLLSLPLYFFCSLRSLEIAFPPNSPTQMRLRLAELILLLSNAQQLEELSISDSILRLVLPSQNDEQQFTSLSRLRHFEWSFPRAREVKPLLSLISMPALEKLDLWVSNEKQPTSESTLNHIGFTNHGQPQWHTRLNPDQPIEYIFLRELSIQYGDTESIGMVLKPFIAPFLRKLEITNMGDIARRASRERGGSVNLSTNGSPGDSARRPLLNLPKLEWVLRDPRLPYLTHMTLSHLEIPGSGSGGLGQERHGKAEVLNMLGYMPALRSLSLDSVSGASAFVHALSQKRTAMVAVTAAAGRKKSPGSSSNVNPPMLTVPKSKSKSHRLDGFGTRNSEGESRGGDNRSLGTGASSTKMKFCPRLEALSFWNCNIKFSDLRELVSCRNQCQPLPSTGAFPRKNDIPVGHGDHIENPNYIISGVNAAPHAISDIGEVGFDFGGGTPKFPVSESTSSSITTSACDSDSELHTIMTTQPSASRAIRPLRKSARCAAAAQGQGQVSLASLNGHGAHIPTPTQAGTVAQAQAFQAVIGSRSMQATNAIATLALRSHTVTQGGRSSRLSSSSQPQLNVSDSTATSAVTGMMSRMDLFDNDSESEPARVVYVRTVGCREISEEDVCELRGMGVVDVLWSGES